MTVIGAVLVVIVVVVAVAKVVVNAVEDVEWVMERM